jgi:uncharacterized protein YfaS (alpha-2-macroglobulin family)
MQTSTTQPSYSRNESAVIIAKALAGSAPVAGATVTFKVTKSNGRMVTGQVVTNSSGSATYTLNLSRKDPIGSYQVNTTASLNGISGSGAASFTVK